MNLTDEQAEEIARRTVAQIGQVPLADLALVRAGFANGVASARAAYEEMRAAIEWEYREWTERGKRRGTYRLVKERRRVGPWEPVEDTGE